MITIKNITIRNFLSVGQNTQAINLCESGLTLVLGKNGDIGATNSRNGVGKTSMIQAIIYALYGEPLTNIRVGNLINLINQKSMLVTIDFSRDGIDYRIERGRKPNILKFFVNNKESGSSEDNDEAKGENKHTQTEIERVIGMSHTLFKHLVALNTFTEPFLRLKPGPQREVIEELLGITQISQRDEALMERIKDTKTKIRDEETTIKAITEANARIEVAITKARESFQAWDRMQNEKTNQLTMEYNDLSQIDFDAEIEVFNKIDSWIETERELKSKRAIFQSENDSLVKESRNLTAEIKRLKDGSIANFDNQIKRLQAEIVRCEAESKKTPDTQIARLQTDAKRRETESASKLKLATLKEAELTAILTEMENADGHSCSTCGQDLDGTDHLAKVMASLTKKAEMIGSEITKYQSDVETLNAEAKAVYDEIETIRQGWEDKQSEWLEKANIIRAEIEQVKLQQETQSKEIEVKIADLENDLSELQLVIQAGLDELQEIDNSIKNLGNKPVSIYRNREQVWKMRESKDKILEEIERERSKENPHTAHIQSLESTLSMVSYETLEEQQLLLKHQEFLHKLLSGKDSFIRKKIIDQNLVYLNTRMNKYLEALALPHEVRFMPDLSVNISILGREFDFEQLSRGEMNRVILATSWSFRDIWESMNTSMNLVMVDEILDNGLDAAGAESALEILNKMARANKNVFLISHNESLIGRCNRVLMVHKNNQFTSFEENAEVI